jgi:NTE family protein
MNKSSRCGIPVVLGVILFAVFLFAADLAWAAGEKPEAALYKVPERPKVALVLSGGGARGIAHIGVLMVLEELRVPVDMVLGTSMGSLVGGVYASGMSPSELEKKVRAINWNTIFNDEPARQDIPWHEKRDDYTNLFGLEFGFRDGKILLPYGTTSGYKFEFLLTDMVGLATGRESRSFDTLPIPFRAVAMDLENGSMKVFDSGVLVKAMRASMSVPAFIAPATIDGHLYVDGGMVRNLPVDVARKAGCEIIIAVNLGTPPLRRDQLTSAAAVAMQSINLMTEHNVQASLAELTEKDILIAPKLGEFSSGDFVQAMETIPIGIAAARAVQDKLERLSVSDADYKAWQLSLAERKPAEVRVSDIQVEKDMKWVNPVVIESEIEKKPGLVEYLVTKQLDDKGIKKLEEIPSAMKKKEGDEMNLEQLQNTLTTLYGRGDFAAMDYSLVKRDGKETILVEGVEKPWGPDYLKFGLGFATDMSTPVRFSVGASYRKTWLNRYGAEWRTDAQLGYTKGLYTEFFQPVGLTVGSFVAPWAAVVASPVNYYNDGTYLGQYGVVKTRGGLDVGVQGKVGMIRLGFYQGYLSANSEFGVLHLPDFNVRQGGFTGRFAIDQLDNADFPREGIFIGGTYFGTDEAFGAQDNYNKYELALRKPFTFFDRHTLTVGLAYADNAGSALPPYDPFTIGGFLNLSGYKFNQLVGQGYSFGEIVYMYQFGSLPSPLGRGLYLGGSLETGQVHHLFDPKASSGWLFGSSVFLGADTILGPFYAAFGYAGDGNTSFYVMLSRPWSAGK